MIKRLPCAALWIVAALALILSGCTAARTAPKRADLHELQAGAPAGRSERVIVVVVSNPVAALPRVAGSTPLLYARRPRYMAGDEATARLAEIAIEYRLQPLAEWPITALGVHCATLLIAEDASRAEVLERLRDDPRVELAQPLHDFETLSGPTVAYDDPYLPLQRGLQQLGVLQAHRCTRGRGTRIAVVDTGIDIGHPDMQGLSATTANFVDRNEARFRLDAHGTQVAGVIAAQPGNARGIVGIAPDALLIALKACWELGNGRSVCNSFSLAQALAAAIDRGAQVINLSLGGPADELLTRLLQKAQSRGAVVIGALPPSGARGGFPVGVPGVIAVGDGRSDALSAPGHEVLTLTPEGRYDFASGSSIAAAHVSAISALLLSRRPGTDAAAIERAMRGAGASAGLDACRALAAVDADCRCAPGP